MHSALPLIAPACPEWLSSLGEGELQVEHSGPAASGDVLGAQARQWFSCDASDLKRHAFPALAFVGRGGFSTHAKGPAVVLALASTALAGRWGFALKGLRVHARSFLRSPQFQMATDGNTK